MYAPPRDSSMVGWFAGAGGSLPIRHGVGGITIKFIHSFMRRLACYQRTHTSYAFSIIASYWTEITIVTNTLS